MVTSRGVAVEEGDAVLIPMTGVLTEEQLFVSLKTLSKGCALSWFCSSLMNLLPFNS